MNKYFIYLSDRESNPEVRPVRKEAVGKKGENIMSRARDRPARNTRRRVTHLNV